MCGASISEAMRQCSACGETVAPDDGQTQSELLPASDFAKAKRWRLIWLLALATAAFRSTSFAREEFVAY